MTKYYEFKISSIGCGASPDLMAFEKMANRKNITYNGIDNNPYWHRLHGLIERYAEEDGYIDVYYDDRDIFAAMQVPSTDIYNVVVLQFFISSVLRSGGTEAQIINIFNTIADEPLRRWKESDLDTPFLIILNDVDHLNKGRNTFYHLIDILEARGHTGTAYAKSAHDKGDLGLERWSGRKNKPGYDNIAYEYSSLISNNSASLVIEVAK